MIELIPKPLVLPARGFLLSELYNESKSITATNILLKGLFLHYPEFKDCKLYASDKEFSTKVEMMPHLSYYEYDNEEDPDLEL